MVNVAKGSCFIYFRCVQNSSARSIWAHLALWTVALTYGINYIWAKEVMPLWVEPSAFILMRVLGASFLFLLLRSRAKWNWPDRKDLPRIALCGLLGVAANQLMFFHGLNLTSPINASIIMIISPMLVVLFGVLQKTESFHLRRGIGFFLAAAGALGLILAGGQISSIESHPLGDLLILANASSYAGYLVLVQPLMKKYKPLDVIQWVFFFGLIIVLPFGLQGFLRVEWTELPTLIAAKIAFVVVATTFLVYLLNLFAISVVGSGTVGLYIYLQPLLAGFFAFLSGMEQPHLAQVGWGLLILTGVVLGSRTALGK